MFDLLLLWKITYIILFISGLLSLTIAYRITFNNSKLINVSFKDWFIIALMANWINILWNTIIYYFIQINSTIANLIISQLFIWTFIYFMMKNKITEKNKLIKLILWTLSWNFLLMLIFFYILFFIIWLISMKFIFNWF